MAITFLIPFSKPGGTTCKAAGNNGGTADVQQAKRNYQLGHVELDADYTAIELHETFMMNGRKYHLLFVRPTDYAKGKVKNVYIYPDGFKSWIQGDLTVDLPVVKEFIVHNVPGQELWGSVIIRETVMSREPANKKNKVYDFSLKDTSTDVRLPDDIAQKILDLIQDNSSYEWAGYNGIKYNRVQTDALRKTKIGKWVNKSYIVEYTDKRTF